MVRLAAILAVWFWASFWAGIAQANCRLALVLALDVSSSVDADEYDLQRLGLAAALNAPDVRHAILHGGKGHVALAVYEWSGFNQQKLHLDWSLLRNDSDIDQAVAVLAKMSRSHDNFPTSIGQALGFGALALKRAPKCNRQVIDMSGDGVNNHGYGPTAAYRNFPFDGVIVNGLVLLGESPDVTEFYRREILRGSGAFLIVANGFEEFRTAMTRKLFREINEITVGQLATPPNPKGG
ncbi:DUF1194 domain-containing protein [Roseovarius sp. EL26]|uniref:DUF1194 domain-containing protein n=1 Tax=Roseovarius sp. EL26 TaxID=2126672 RepID=UPI000EA3E6CE|nr:DUF1194 domain-containing protein [Roseovarius sp. EL26]